MTLQFFLTEIVARAIAVYLCFDSIGILQRAFAERRIEYVETALISILLGSSNWIAQRDTMPLRFWGLAAGHVMTVAACVVVAIFGWWVPDT
jgi:hypothetical protein